MTTYALDQAGVLAWQTDLYQSDESAQTLEREFIHADFEGWLADRFGATDRQLDYLATLPESFVHQLRDELVLSLRAKLPIEFDRQPSKPEASIRSGDSVKVTEFEKWLNGEGEGEEEEEEEITQVDSRQQPNRPSSLEGRFLVRTYHRRP